MDAVYLTALGVLGLVVLYVEMRRRAERRRAEDFQLRWHDLLVNHEGWSWGSGDCLRIHGLSPMPPPPSWNDNRCDDDSKGTVPQWREIPDGIVPWRGRFVPAPKCDRHEWLRMTLAPHCFGEFPDEETEARECRFCGRMLYLDMNNGALSSVPAPPRNREVRDGALP